MLTGVIKPLSRTQPLDRLDVSYPLWEQHAKPNPIDLPWPNAATFDGGHVRDLLSSARTLVLAGSRLALYQHVIAAMQPGMRAYAYGASTMEGERGMQDLARTSEQMVIRLGYELPADWIVVDEGRAGVLLVGPPAAERRWAIPLAPDAARSLFEAFRVLFWFHARREWMPDSARNFAFRSPLPSPYRDPGRDVSLPAGRLVIDRPLPDLVPDAEFRIVPDGSTPGRAATVLAPPISGLFAAARRIAATGRLVWMNTGLPRTTISRQRLVMDLVTGPVGIQLEWETGIAIDVLHRVQKACETPGWTFHVARRLRDVAGLVILEGASAAAPVMADERIDLPDLRASLATFEAATPPSWRAPSPLAKNVVYAWRTLPEVVPAGAGKAQIIRQWTALDEWASRSVTILRQRLSSMEGEERGILDRLKGLWRGHSVVARERKRIGDALVEIGEQPPSQRSDAAELVLRLAEEVGKIHGLLNQAHREHQNAEDEAEERGQREACRARVEQAATELMARRAALAELEGKATTADLATRDAEAARLRRISELRAIRLARLTKDRDRDEPALAEAKKQLKALNTQHRGKAPKAERAPLAAEIARLEHLVAEAKQELLAIDAWSPTVAELTAESGRLKEARAALVALQRPRTTLTSDLARLERAAAEVFAYRPGPRLQTVSLPDVVAAPTVPTEGPPELGELFEHQGERFLAVRTWEQVAPASGVAARLLAKLVAFPDATK